MPTAPYAHRVTRVTIQGQMFGGAEEWSTGFYMGQVGADAQLPNQGQADAIRDAWATFHTHAQSYISNQYKPLVVKLSSFGTDGKADANDTVYSSFASNVAGARSELLPPQCSLVATLQGVNNRGLASKGRMYLPGVVIGLTTTGTTDPFNTNLIAVNLKNFFNTVNASTATDDLVILASHGSINKDGTPKVGGKAPLNQGVTRIQIGTVYDTQRRRRNGLTEQYQQQELTNMF